MNSEGELFAWGKGERGQLGQDVMHNYLHTAVPIKKAIAIMPDTGKPIYHSLRNVLQIDAGMLHSAALDDDNNVYTWGKNVLPNFTGRSTVGQNPFDAKLPIQLKGLPPHLGVERIACGSHHTSVLMEDGSVWAIGVSSDTKEIIHDAVCMIPAGIVDLPVRQFAAHMDRTTVVGADGRQVFQVNLWKDANLQEFALFTPSWIQNLLDSDDDIRVREVHRSWLHSVVVTDECIH